MRLEALKQCKGIIEYKLEDLSRNLGEFIQGIANMVLDIESEPRKEALKQLSALLSSTCSDTVKPFFNILCSYLRCGMTHIQSSVQRDSLLLLDSLVTNLPTLIASRSDLIFKDFLDMISKSKSDARSSRTLTLNVENKTTNIKWRSEVLLRLHSMLSTVIEFKFNTKSAFYQGQPKALITFNSKEPNYFSMVNSFPNHTASSATLIFRSNTSENVDECTKYQRFIEQLLPLLFETWLEVSLSAKSDRALKEDISLSLDSAMSLKIILEIILKIWDIVEYFDKEMKNTDFSAWFRNTYSDDFKNYMMHLFPYKQTTVSNLSRCKPKNNSESPGGSACYTQNLIICILYCKFFKNKIEHESFNKLLLDYVSSEFSLFYKKK